MVNTSIIGFWHRWKAEYFYNELECKTCGFVQRKATDWTYQKCKHCEDYLYDERQ